MLWRAVGHSVSAVPLQCPFCQHHPFLSQVSQPAPTLCRHAPVHPTRFPRPLCLPCAAQRFSPRSSFQGPCACWVCLCAAQHFSPEALPKLLCLLGLPCTAQCSPCRCLSLGPCAWWVCLCAPRRSSGRSFLSRSYFGHTDPSTLCPAFNWALPVTMRTLCGRDLCRFVQLFFHSRLHGFSASSSRSCTSKAVACFAVGLARAWRPTVAAQHTQVLAAGPGGTCTPAALLSARDSSLQQWETHCEPAPFGQHPDGLPSLQGHDLARVTSANSLCVCGRCR